MALAAIVIWYVMAASPLISNNGAYSGIWEMDFESSVFFPCDSEAVWRFEPETDEPYNLFRDITGIANIREYSGSGRLFVRVQGEVGPKLELPYPDRTLSVSRVESMSLEIPPGCDREF